jgi:HK97 gp10 family phage protein
MMVETFRVEGLRELERKLKQLPGKIAKSGLRKALFSGAKIVRTAAERLVPKDTGFLQAQIIQYAAPKSKHSYADQVRIGVRARARKLKSGKVNTKHVRYRRIGGKDRAITAHYWKYIEFGTSKMAARPFLRPAFNANAVAAAERIKTRLRENIEKVAKK